MTVIVGDKVQLRQLLRGSRFHSWLLCLGPCLAPAQHGRKLGFHGPGSSSLRPPSRGQLCCMEQRVMAALISSTFCADRAAGLASQTSQQHGISPQLIHATGLSSNVPDLSLVSRRTAFPHSQVIALPHTLRSSYIMKFQAFGWWHNCPCFAERGQSQRGH